MSNYLSRGETLSGWALSPRRMCEKPLWNMEKMKSAPCMCFCPLSIITAPPYRVSGLFWTDRVCPSRTGGSRWWTQVPPSPTREECGVVHMCKGPLGALADEGLGCRRALKNVRGFRMRLKVPLGYHDPWHLLAGPCTLFCDLRMVPTCGEIQASLQLIQKFHLAAGCSGESSNDWCTFKHRRMFTL